MAAYYLLAVLLMANFRLLDYWPFEAVLVLICITAPLGAYWMVYQSIRYEKHVGRYVLYSFIPFLFIWYYRERYRNRQRMQRLPIAVR